MPSTLETRLASLEQQVAKLTDRLAKVENTTPSSPEGWRKWIGAFTDDEGMKEVFAEAQKLRDADRQRAYRRATPKPSRRS
jgi:carbamate kinase